MELQIQRMSDSGSGGGGPNGNPVGPPGQPPPAPPYTPPPGPYTPPPAAPPPQYGAPPQTPYPLPPAPPPPQQPPYQPPAYPQQAQQPPQYVPPPAYAPTYAPPAPQGYQQPMQPGFAPPPAKKGGSRTLLVVGIVAAFLVVVLAGGGFLANASFSTTYSAGKAVSAYFAAQSRGDADYMVANANYLKGDSGTDPFFNSAAVAAMAGEKENQAVTGVNVTSTQQLDSSTDKVAVSMSWNGSQVTQTYTVHKDTTRTHFIFYNDWKLDIPASSVSITLPNQPGAVTIDGISVPSGSSSVAVIQGFHTVTMQQTTFYDAANQTANAVGGAASVAFTGSLNSNANAQAAASVKAAFADNSWCDPGVHTYCPGHTYHPQSGYYEIFTLPNGKKVNAYSSWIYTYTGDASSGMKLSVSSTANEVEASGTCGEKLVLDGKQTVNLSGTWSGTLTWNNGAFDYDILLDCRSSVA